MVSSAWKRVLNTGSYISAVMLELSEIMGSYTTSDTAVRDRQQKQVME